MASTAVFALPDGSSWQPAIWMQQFLWTTLHGRPLSDGRIRGRPAPRVKNLLEGGGQAAVRECFTSPARPTAGQPLLTGRPLAGSRLWRCREVASDFGVWPRCASLRAPPRGTQEAVRVRTSWRGRPGTSSPGHSCRWRRPSFRRPRAGRSGTTRIRPPPPSGRPAAAGPIGLEAVHEDLEVVAELLRDRPLHDVHRLVAGLGRVVGDAHVVFGDKAPEERVAEEHHQPRDRARVEGGGAPGRLLTAVENGGAGRSKMVALGGVDLP
jgi:hypothetical protein